ncbi:hypothetical protein AAY473_034830 [Plecturocebus cupreus]
MGNADFHPIRGALWDRSSGRLLSLAPGSFLVQANLLLPAAHLLFRTLTLLPTFHKDPSIQEAEAGESLELRRRRL